MKWIQSGVVALVVCCLGSAANAGLLETLKGDGKSGNETSSADAPAFCRPSRAPVRQEGGRSDKELYQQISKIEQAASKSNLSVPPMFQTKADTGPIRCAPTSARVRQTRYIVPRRCVTDLKACDTSVANCAAPDSCCTPVKMKGCDTTCAAPEQSGSVGKQFCADANNPNCDGICGPRVTVRSEKEGWKLARLIYQAQTACHARDRLRAIHRIGDNYSCQCNPEIICALLHGLNDKDDNVREKAADEIGDQLRKNPCCCTPELVQALSCALGDCDKGVVDQVEEALDACGFKIVDDDACCEGSACDNSNPPVEQPKVPVVEVHHQSVPTPTYQRAALARLLEIDLSTED